MDLLPLRVQRIFDSMFKPDPVQLNPVNMDQNAMNPDDPNNALRALLTPAHESADRYKEMLAQQPQREDYKPTKLTNVLSRIQALGGSGAAGQANGQMIGYKSGGINNMNMQDHLLNKGYNDATDDWNAKLKPLNELADSERSSNTNNRMIAATTMRDQNNDADRDARAKIAEDKIRHDAEEKAAYRLFLREKAAQPNADFMSDKAGRVYSVDKKTGKFLGFVKDLDGNVMTDDKLPEADRIAMQQKNAMSRIAATGAETRKTAETRGEVAEETSHETVADKIAVKAATPGKNTTPTGGAKTDSKTMVSVIRKDGKTGQIPADKLAEALQSGNYTLPPKK